MYEHIFVPDDVATQTWIEGICDHIHPAEWCLLKDCLDPKKAIDSRGPREIIRYEPFTINIRNYDVEEIWHWTETCQHQGREYHIYVHCDDYYHEPIDTVIIREVGPDLHVNVDVTNQWGKPPRVEFTYTFTGNPICELAGHAVEQLMPSDFDAQLFFRHELGLTNQQCVFLHKGPALKEFGSPQKTNTTARQT